MNKKKCPARLLIVLLIAAAWAANASAQARPNLSLARVIYNSAKSQANPQGELKEKLAVIDKALAEAARIVGV